MSSTTITREQLQIALLRYGEWVENKFNESYILHLKSEAEDLVFWSRFRSRITFGLCKVKTLEKAFAEAKENYGNWNRLEGPDFFYHYSWREAKANELQQLLGSDDHFRHDHKITITDRHAFILDWIQ